MEQSKGAKQPEWANHEHASTTRDEFADAPEKPTGTVIETNTASVALASAMAEHKPSPFS